MKNELSISRPRAAAHTVAIICAIALVLTLCGCVRQTAAPFSDSKPVPAAALDENEFLDINADEWFLDGQGFDFERYTANETYRPYEDNIEVPDSERNDIVSYYSHYAFDDGGSGIFVVLDPGSTGMNQRAYYLEYTNDYGKTWNVLEKGFYSTFFVYGAEISGSSVYLTLYSEMYHTTCIVCTNDMFGTVRVFDICKFFPEYDYALDYTEGYFDIVNVDWDTGWLTIEGYVPMSGDAVPEHRKCFMLFRTDFKTYEMLYCDSDYLANARKTIIDELGEYLEDGGLSDYDDPGAAG